MSFRFLPTTIAGVIQIESDYLSFRRHDTNDAEARSANLYNRTEWMGIAE